LAGGPGFAGPFVSLVLLTAIAAGCGSEDTIRAEGAERTIAGFVNRETGFRPTDVRCPSGVEAKVGEKFECSFTGPEGRYTAFMEVRKVDGDDVLFRIDTRRAGGS
jgi:Domain of unknown function (DUF4333)